jgi:hypothetical protein
MRNRLMVAGAAFVLMLSACDHADPEAHANRSVGSEDDYPERLEAMPEGQRHAVFIRAIRDAGRECQHVERSIPRGWVNGAPAWIVECDGGLEWTIIIGKAGIAQVTNSAELKAAGAT